MYTLGLCVDVFFHFFFESMLWSEILQLICGGLGLCTSIYADLQCDASRFSHWNVARRFSRRKSPLVVCAVFGGMFLYSGKMGENKTSKKNCSSKHCCFFFPPTPHFEAHIWETDCSDFTWNVFSVIFATVEFQHQSIFALLKSHSDITKWSWEQVASPNYIAFLNVDGFNYQGRVVYVLPIYSKIEVTL